MIFVLDNKTFGGWSDMERTILGHEILMHNHFVDCEREVRQKIVELLGEQAQKAQPFSITDEQRTFLATIKAKDYSYKQLVSLAKERARLLIENGPYEWNVYKSMAEAYSKDRTYGNVFAMIDRAVKRHDLHCLHGGGCSVYPALIELEERECYKDGVFEKKHVVIFDRDTDGFDNYSQEQNTLFTKLCGKKSGSVAAQDVYTVEQQPYRWHVWCKRAIENYFTNDRYQALHVDTTQVPERTEDRDYCEMSKVLGQYGKKMMANISKGMKRDDFERYLMRFDVDIEDRKGKKTKHNVSEFQLLLLKIAKII